MKSVTFAAILISFTIGFAAILLITCCLGIGFLLMWWFVFTEDDGEEKDIKKANRKVYPMLGINPEEVKHEQYEVILVNSDWNVGNDD